jgi:hypothetical protein
MPKRKNPDPKSPKPVDTFLGKRRRGRPEKIPRAWVIGRAPNYRKMLSDVWSKLAEPLLAAETTERVIQAFETHAQPYTNKFVPEFAADILELIHDPLFPKRAKAQIGFLGDSLAGRPDLTARRSRDICAKARKEERAKSPHHILRKEFYVECSCGYKGPALHNSCRKCGAEIDFTADILLGRGLG